MERQRPSPAEVSLQDERLDAALALLEAGVEEALTSTGFQRYLRAMSTFHDYSPNNILLIMAQRPGAVKVAGYRRWKSLGRHVRAGEHGIRIIAPIVRQQTDPETGRPGAPGWLSSGDGLRPLPDRRGAPANAPAAA